MIKKCILAFLAASLAGCGTFQTARVVEEGEYIAGAGVVAVLAPGGQDELALQLPSYEVFYRGGLTDNLELDSALNIYLLILYCPLI